MGKDRTANLLKISLMNSYENFLMKLLKEKKGA